MENTIDDGCDKGIGKFSRFFIEDDYYEQMMNYFNIPFSIFFT
jgi:hypothetical protein